MPIFNNEECAQALNYLALSGYDTQQISDEDVLTIGMVNDMYAESRNDEAMDAYAVLADQKDFDLF